MLVLRPKSVNVLGLRFKFVAWTITYAVLFIYLQGDLYQSLKVDESFWSLGEFLSQFYLEILPIQIPNIFLLVHTKIELDWMCSL